MGVPPQMTLARWLKADGDTVWRGQAICEIESDSASVEVEAWTNGVLRHLAREGERIHDRTVVARIE